MTTHSIESVFERNLWGTGVSCMNLKANNTYRSKRVCKESVHRISCINVKAHCHAIVKHFKNGVASMEALQ